MLQVSSQSDHLQCLLGATLKVLLHALSRHQSTFVLHNMFATQRSLVFKVAQLFPLMFIKLMVICDMLAVFLVGA